MGIFMKEMQKTLQIDSAAPTDRGRVAAAPRQHDIGRAVAVDVPEDQSVEPELRTGDRAGDGLQDRAVVARPPRRISSR